MILQKMPHYVDSILTQEDASAALQDGQVVVGLYTNRENVQSVGRLIVPQNAPFKKAQRAWQPPTNGDAAKPRTVYEFAEKENAAE